MTRSRQANSSMTPKKWRRSALLAGGTVPVGAPCRRSADVDDDLHEAHHPVTGAEFPQGKPLVIKLESTRDRFADHAQGLGQAACLRRQLSQSGQDGGLQGARARQCRPHRPAGLPRTGGPQCARRPPSAIQNRPLRARQWP